MQNISPDNLDEKLDQIIAKNEGLSPVEPSEEEQEKFLRGYSISALVFGPIYFALMNDTVYFWLSLVGAVVFFPILFFLPIKARRRAWQKRRWLSFNQFETNQKKWSRFTIVGAILLILIIYLPIHYGLQLLNSDLKNAGANGASQLQNDIKTIEQ